MADAQQVESREGLCTLWWRKGECRPDLPAWVRARIAEAGPPALSWLEPRPALAPGGARGRMPGYRMLYVGEPILGMDVHEMRLFWPGRALHLVTQPAVTAWVEIHEAAQSPVGGWNQIQEVRYVRYPLRTWQDVNKRFAGLPSLQGVDTVRMIEYWQGGSLFAWRIEHPANA